MSKEKKYSKEKIKAQPVHKKKPAAANNRMLYYVVGTILLVTYLCYTPAFNNEFTNWDDPVYVTENKLIEKVSSENIKKIFNPETSVSLNYHPVTVLSLALNYKYSGLNPKPYFVVNVLFHLLNTLLVFVFIYKLSNKNIFIAGITSAFFGLHPMHVESAAWISERKDVLYTFFFLSAAIFYLRYLSAQKTTFLIFTFILFLLSCLSKAMAVSFVPVLFLIDYLQQRNFTVKTLLEKTPFVLLALLIGYHAVVVQSQEAINEFSTFTIAQRFMFASYGFMMYVSKLFAPFHLSAFYPYPNVNDLGNIPSVFYIAPVISLAIVAIPALLLWKYKKELLPIYIFGMSFFIVTIALVLQFISVGSAIMADRYSYVPYIGIFFTTGHVLYNFIHNKKILTVIGIASSLVFAYLCYNRVQVWHNTETLWTDVIDKYPMRVEVAYKNRGNYYAQAQRLDEAYNDHVILIDKMKSNDVGALVNYANICGLKKDYEKSLEAYSKALQIKKKDNFDIYLNRAITYSIMQKFDLALTDFGIAATMKPDDDKLMQNRGFVYLQVKEYDKAIADYDILIQRYPTMRDYPFNKGLALFNKGLYKESIVYFNKSIQISPDYKEAYFNISVANKQIGQYKEALTYAQKAMSMGHPVTEAYMNELNGKVK